MISTSTSLKYSSIWGLATLPSQVAPLPSQEAPRLIALGVLLQLPAGAEVPAHISNAFCVPKPESGNFRLRRLNVASKAHPCRYETLKLLRRWGINDTWMVKVDLQDAFYHIPIAPADKTYFIFRFCGLYHR